jgi:hypothetical protein
MAFAAVLVLTACGSPSDQETRATDAVSPDLPSPDLPSPEPVEPDVPAEPTALAPTYVPPPQPPPEEIAPATLVSGHAYDGAGNPLQGVLMQFYIVPRGYGDLYRTETGPDGSYAYELPEGVYNVFATYYFSDAPGDEAALLTDSGDASVPITVPPEHVIDWYLP